MRGYFSYVKSALSLRCTVTLSLDRAVVYTVGALRGTAIERGAFDKPITRLHLTDPSAANMFNINSLESYT